MRWWKGFVILYGGCIKKGSFLRCNLCMIWWHYSTHDYGQVHYDARGQKKMGNECVIYHFSSTIFIAKTLKFLVWKFVMNYVAKTHFDNAKKSLFQFFLICFNWDFSKIDRPSRTCYHHRRINILFISLIHSTLVANSSPFTLFSSLLVSCL